MKLAVVGGGPIGLYTAITLAKQGHEIHLFEKRDWPIDKVCGQGIMASGAAKLQSLDLSFSDAFYFKGISYNDSDLHCEGVFEHVGIAVERKVLSTSLYEKAKEFTNLYLHANTPVQQIDALSDHVLLEVNGRVESFDYLFACDGLHSFVREKLNLTLIRKGDLRMGARTHFDKRPWSENVEVYWSNGIEAYVTPVSPNKIEVSFLWYQDLVTPSEHLYKELISFFPELLVRLKDEEPLDFKGYGPFKKYSKKIKEKNVYLVGDAYCFIDGITGEGISLGLEASTYICKNFHSWNFIKALKIFLLYFHYTFFVRFALFFSKRPLFRRWILKNVLSNPSIFSGLLSLNDKKPFV